MGQGWREMRKGGSEWGGNMVREDLTLGFLMELTGRMVMPSDGMGSLGGKQI